MLWIKRNLIFAIALLVAVGLFGYGCFYAYTAWSQNSELQTQIEQADADLKKIYNSPGTFPSPTNITVLRSQELEVRQFLTNALAAQSRITFDPAINPAAFKTLLDNTIAELGRDADRARVAVVQRDFSFSSIKPLVSFVEGSVPLLAEQLAEIKVVVGVLLRSEISSLDSIRREAVSKDDAGTVSTADYHNLVRRTNELTGEISSFYSVTFHGFSESLAAFIDNVQKSKEVLAVRILTAAPASAQRAGVAPLNPLLPASPVAQPPFVRTPLPGTRPGPVVAAPVRRLETLADEKAFRVSALIEVIKPPLPAPAEPAQ
ncbi:MAG: hypothetical protein FJ405_09010 [Verrucomicrobia bacterium]|nr:hypothetical protein [Verrucomicrobiota bacterium]